MKEKNCIRLSAVGDLILNGKIESSAKVLGTDYHLKYCRDIFRECDIAFANLECVISNNGVRTKYKPKSYPTFLADENMVQIITNSGINLLNLSNNHIFDYGWEAYCNTIKILEENNINYFGAGKNNTDAEKPIFIQKNGLNIGFIGYSLHIGDKHDLPKVVKITYNNCQEIIKNTKNKCDTLIVSLHHGVDFYHYPTSNVIDLSHKLIDCGANLILGHHPHVLQRIEYYKNAIIVYSLGNFLSYHTDKNFKKRLYNDSFLIKNCDFEKLDYNDIRMNETIIITAEIRKDKISKFNIIPIMINDKLQPIPAKGDLARNIINKINKYSYGLTDKSQTMVVNIDEYLFIKSISSTLKNYIISFYKIHKIRFKHLKEIINIIKFIFRKWKRNRGKIDY